VDPIALGAALQSYGPWALLALSLLANKYLFDKLMWTLGEWRKDSQQQSEKLTSILEEAARQRRNRQ